MKQTATGFARQVSTLALFACFTLITACDNGKTDFVARVHYQAAVYPKSFQSYLDRHRNEINANMWKCIGRLESKFLQAGRWSNAECHRNYGVKNLNCYNLAAANARWLQFFKPILSGKVKYRNTREYRVYIRSKRMFSHSFVEKSARMNMPFLVCR